MKTYIMTGFIVLLSMTHLFGQRDEAVLIFKDGSTMEGLAQLTNREAIKFKETKKAKRQVYTFQEVDTLKIFFESRTITYTMVDVKDESDPELLEVLSKEGRVIHYQKTKYGGGIRPYAVHYTYLRKKSQDEATKFGSDALFAKNFKRVAAQFFSDCENLAKQIQNGQFERNDIKEIIKIYNEDCE